MKYCKQACTLPQTSTWRSTNVPRAFQDHFAALKSLLQESHPAMVHLTADETIYARDENILNVLASKAETMPRRNEDGGMQPFDPKPGNVDEMCC